jgi:hypothetical protein
MLSPIVEQTQGDAPMDQETPASERTARLSAKLQHFVESLAPEERDDLKQVLVLALTEAQNADVRGYFLPTTHSLAPLGASTAPQIQGLPSVHHGSVGDTGGYPGTPPLTPQQVQQLLADALSRFF